MGLSLEIRKLSNAQYFPVSTKDRPIYIVRKTAWLNFSSAFLIKYSGVQKKKKGQF